MTNPKKIQLTLESAEVADLRSGQVAIQPSDDKLAYKDHDGGEHILTTDTNLVTSVNGEVGAVVLDTSDIDATTDKNYVTDAESVVIGNTSGTNTGDQDLSILALKSNVLELDNTDAFTPDADYEPATKKYVDDNSGGGGDATSIQGVDVDSNVPATTGIQGAQLRAAFVENRYLDPTDFNTGNWTRTGITVDTTSEPSPIEANYQAIKETATSGAHWFRQNVATPDTGFYKNRIFIKKGTRTKVLLLKSIGTARGAYIDLKTGDYYGQGTYAEMSDVTVEGYAEGYEVTYTFVRDASTANLDVYILDEDDSLSWSGVGGNTSIYVAPIQVANVDNYGTYTDEYTTGKQAYLYNDVDSVKNMTCVGDSLVEGTGSTGGTYPYWLNQLVNNRTVLNVGVGGTEAQEQITDQLLKAITKYHIDFKVDTIPFEEFGDATISRTNEPRMRVERGVGASSARIELNLDTEDISCSGKIYSDGTAILTITDGTTAFWTGDAVSTVQYPSFDFTQSGDGHLYLEVSGGSSGNYVDIEYLNIKLNNYDNASESEVSIGTGFNDIANGGTVATIMPYLNFMFRQIAYNGLVSVMQAVTPAEITVGWTAPMSAESALLNTELRDNGKCVYLVDHLNIGGVQDNIYDKFNFDDIHLNRVGYKQMAVNIDNAAYRKTIAR